MSEKPLSFAVFFYYMYFGFDSSEANFFMLSGLLMNTIDVHALHIFGIVLCTAYLYIMLVISSAMYELQTYLRKTFYFSLALFSMLIFTSIIIHLPLPPNLRFFDAVVFSFTLQY